MVSVAERFPELVKFWHPTRNGSLTPEGCSWGSRKKIWWLGECGHEWTETPQRKAGAANPCPVCVNKRLAVGVNDVYTLYPELAVLWHPTRNEGKTLQDFVPGTAKKAWWLGACGHEWETSIRGMVSGSRECVYCSGQEVLAGFNDLETMRPDLATQWHPTRNGELTPDLVHYGSSRKVWWQCDKGHSWEATVWVRKTKATGCPYCSGRLVIPGGNSLAVANPALATEWHPTLNGALTPDLVKPVSHQQVWWQCDKGHEWKAIIGNRAAGRGCAVCGNTGTSRGEQGLADFIVGLVGEGQVVRNARNVLGNKQEVDIYVPSKNVAVEYNGLYWHSEATGKGKTYHYDKWKACKEQGIQLIQIWEDDYVRNPGLVKRMLAHKLGVSAGVKVFARKTTVVGLKRGIVEPFLVENHLQGFRTATYYGLVLKGGDAEKPVAVMGVARKSENGLEIIRFATSSNVVGGFTKLLKHVLKQPEFRGVEHVYSYSHNDHSDGGVYEKNGFELVHEGTPGYSYWRNGWGVREHRLKYSPSRVKTNPDLIYEEGASEKRLAELNGLTRVWDSGSTLWVRQVK